MECNSLPLLPPFLPNLMFFALSPPCPLPPPPRHIDLFGINSNPSPSRSPPTNDCRKSTQQQARRGSTHIYRGPQHHCTRRTAPKFRASDGGQTPPRPSATRSPTRLLPLHRILPYCQRWCHCIPRPSSERRRCVFSKFTFDLPSKFQCCAIQAKLSIASFSPTHPPPQHSICTYLAPTERLEPVLSMLTITTRATAAIAGMGALSPIPRHTLRLSSTSTSELTSPSASLVTPPMPQCNGRSQTTSLRTGAGSTNRSKSPVRQSVKRR